MCAHARTCTPTHTQSAPPHLLEGLQDLLPLAEVAEEQLQGPRHQGRVVVHGQVQQHSEEGPAAVVVQVQRRVLLTAGDVGGNGQ